LGAQDAIIYSVAGSPQPITMDPTGAFVGCFIGIPLKFECRNLRGRKIKKKLLNIYLASRYHPCHDIPHKEFNEVFNSLLQRLPQNVHVIMGANINAKLG